MFIVLSSYIRIKLIKLYRAYKYKFINAFIELLVMYEWKVIIYLKNKRHKSVHEKHMITDKAMFLFQLNDMFYENIY